MRVRFIIASVLACSAVAGEGAQAPTATSWQRLVAEDGTVLGYSSQQERKTAAGTERLVHQQILLEAAGKVTQLTGDIRSLVDRTGRPSLITSTVRVGRGSTRTEARIDGGWAELTRTTPYDRRTVTIQLPADIQLEGDSRLLARWDPAAAPKLEFDVLNVDAMAVEHIVIEAAKPGDSGANDGAFEATRRRYRDGELRGIAKLTIGAGGRIVALTQPMFGSSVTSSPTSRAKALRKHKPFRVLNASMVKAPFRIPQAALEGRIQYRFAFRDGIAFPLPEAPEQRARAAGDGAILDVCTTCGADLATDPAALALATRPTAWLQSDAPELQAIAAPVARQLVSDARKMELLLERAKPLLGRSDHTGHYSALETLKRRAGDCTEAAVLLAALGRAAGIPTKVVNGLVYSRQSYHGVSNVFMPHSWTYAFVDGHWRSFDLALGEFDSSHIALTIGDGDSNSVLAASQLASLIVWKDMAEIRSRKAN